MSTIARLKSGNLKRQITLAKKTIAGWPDGVRLAMGIPCTSTKLAATFQSRVQLWMLECFTPAIVTNKVERNHRYLEESLELVQSLGCTCEEAHMLVEYVFGRPAGEPRQETGGVMVTLAALGNANGIDITDAADTELARCWTKIEQIRAKQVDKPKCSPLPQPPPATERDKHDAWEWLRREAFAGNDHAAVAVIEWTSLKRATPAHRKCQDDMYADPPRDCDAPFCGCNPEWTKVIEMLQECGWKSSQELRASAEPRTLPEVGGDTLPTTLAQFEHRAKHYLAEEQAKVSPDNALIGLLCDAVRLARENERMARSGIPEPPAPDPTGNWPLEVFQPLPTDEAKALRDYGADDSRETPGAIDWKARAEAAESILSHNMALANATTRRARAERDAIIKKMRERYSAIEIADMVGLTRQRVHQILNEPPVEASESPAASLDQRIQRFPQRGWSIEIGVPFSYQGSPGEVYPITFKARHLRDYMSGDVEEFEALDLNGAVSWLEQRLVTPAAPKPACNCRALPDEAHSLSCPLSCG